MSDMTVYVLRDPRDHAVRYVGTTHKTLDARLDAHMDSTYRDANVAPRYVWLRELRSLGLVPIIEAVDHTTESDWSEVEQKWIDHYRAAGCDLLNVKRGGGGPSANAKRKSWTTEQRARQSARTAQRYVDDPSVRDRVSVGTRAGMAAYMAENYEEHRQKVSDGLRRRYQNPDARARTGESTRQTWEAATPEERKRRTEAWIAAADVRVSCPTCGMTSRPGNIARHRRVKGH